MNSDGLSAKLSRPDVPFWLIGCGVEGDKAWGFEALSVWHEGRKVLLLFSDEGQAEVFAWLVVIEGVRGLNPGGGRLSGGEFRTGDLQPRACGRGELISLLFSAASGLGPCRGVDGVVFDPQPEILFAEDFEDLEVEMSSVDRESVIERLVEQGYTRFDERAGEKGERSMEKKGETWT